MTRTTKQERAYQKRRLEKRDERARAKAARIRRAVSHVPFSRANIYARDEHKCQYCGDGYPTGELTFDHVVPVAHGGRKDWENIVTCCITCNRRKGGRTPEQAGMRLMRPPKRPSRASTSMRAPSTTTARRFATAI